MHIIIPRIVNLKQSFQLLNVQKNVRGRLIVPLYGYQTFNGFLNVYIVDD